MTTNPADAEPDDTEPELEAALLDERQLALNHARLAERNFQDEVEKGWKPTFDDHAAMAIMWSYCLHQ